MITFLTSISDRSILTEEIILFSLQCEVNTFIINIHFDITPLLKVFYSILKI